MVVLKLKFVPNLDQNGIPQKYEQNGKVSKCDQNGSVKNYLRGFGARIGKTWYVAKKCAKSILII